MTAGGRVLNVTGIGATPGEARDRAYAAAERIQFDGKQMRTDIAARAVERVEAELETGGHRRPRRPRRRRSEHQFDDLEVDAPLVGIVMGSKSRHAGDGEGRQGARGAGIHHELRVMSAHRDPEVVADYAKNARMRGLKVIIAGAGLAAALPGVVAAHTELPVIGVPLTSKTSVAGGLDALLAIAQMPPGVPVACVGVDAAKNAAVLAAQDPRRRDRSLHPP